MNNKDRQILQTERDDTLQKDNEESGENNE